MRRNVFTASFILFAAVAGTASLTAQSSDRGIVEVGRSQDLRLAVVSTAASELGLVVRAKQVFRSSKHFTEPLTKLTFVTRSRNAE